MQFQISHLLAVTAGSINDLRPPFLGNAVAAPPLAGQVTPILLAKRAGKIPGIWTGSASEALRRHEQGGLFLTTGGDGPWVVEGARRTLAELGR